MWLRSGFSLLAGFTPGGWKMKPRLFSILSPISEDRFFNSCNFEFDSNVTDVSDWQLEKQDLYNTLTDAGT
jgi:hypothetical protein